MRAKIVEGLSLSRPSSTISTDGFHEDWQILGLLGEGSFAEVHEVKCRRSGRSEAVKVFDMQKANAYIVMEEASIMKRIGKHEHVASLIDAYRYPDVFLIVMEKYNSTLRNLIQASMLSELNVSNLCMDMLSAIAYLNSKRIVHRDCKPENFLYGRQNDQSLKLCDFGMATFLPRSGKLYGTHGITQQIIETAYCTPAYMSPEMVCNGPHDFKTDVWSIGVICYEMLFGELPYAPYQRRSDIMQKTIAQGPEPNFTGFRDVTMAAKSFAGILLNRQMSSRISASKARLLLPFLEQFAPAGEEDIPSFESSIYVSSRQFSIGATESTCDGGSISSFDDIPTERLISL